MENLHVTLRFLGSVADERREEALALASLLPGVATSANVIELTGFPHPDRATAIVARLAVDERLRVWHETLRRTWPMADSPREFDPHVTLARSRRRISVSLDKALQGLELELQPPAAYLSDTRAEGAVYRQLMA